ncbi:MAG TPA: PDR/VanB family oxidoreductase [Novimethylophilus sp.]|uniref:PDR/VanB family oxidoreductase n=1 Tax=Novimethylophilus sp. TaxID=2137426 RepID=UPI002F4149CE
MSTVNVRVAAIEQVTPMIKHFTLVREDGQAFPTFSGGSHVVVAMDINGRTHRNAYSMMGAPEDTQAYHISVRREERSRGGSVFMHDNVVEGSSLQITLPVNLFALSKLGRKHILIAGGIGITPFMSQLHDIQRNGYSYELHYAFRSPEHGAFSGQLKARCGDLAHFYADSLGRKLDIRALLSAQPLGSHVYVCGPASMVTAVLETARELGWPENHIHSEQFSAPPTGDAFKVRLAKSNIEVEVPSDITLLEALETAGVNAESLCRGGACGRCELDVLELDGEIFHHDHYLSDAEKAAGRKIMPCVSRARCTHMLLNI